MSLSAKLEGDNLSTMCQKEVEELHRLFVAWFQGESTAAALTADLKSRLDPGFSHVAPNGQFLQGRDVLIGHLQDKFGCYKDRLFQIDIYAVQLLWHANGQALCTYEEWQSWQPEDETEEIHQFGRLSTCLLHRRVNANGEKRYQWIHVHETWLEEEEPQHPNEERMSTTAKPSTRAIDDDTVMTGPVLPPSLKAKAVVEQQQQQQESAPPPQGDDDGAAPAAAADADEKNGETPQRLPLPPETEKHVLMLVSNQSLSRDQIERQDKARVMLEGLGIGYYELNGADQEQRDKRNELFKLSGRWGKYPQFFLFDTDGNTVFWGDWDDLEASNEKGNLLVDMQQNFPKKTDGDDDDEDEDDDDDEDDDEDNDDDDDDEDDTEKKAEDETPTENGAAKKPNISQPPGLLLLISSQVLSADHKERQQDVVDTLKSKKIPYLEVDGSVPEKREQRNELFKLSKVWGLYPQIFKIDPATRDITYWGGWEDFEDAKENETLESSLLASQNDNGDKKKEAPPESAPEVSRGLPVQATPQAANGVNKGGISKDMARKKLAESKAEVMLLISNHSLSIDQMARQDNLRLILKDKKVDYTEVDGSARESRDKRNELFKVSKLWGRYPQVFVTNESGETSFWGEWEEIDESNKKGTLLRDLAKVAGIETGEIVADDNADEAEAADEANASEGEASIHISDGEDGDEEEGEAEPEEEEPLENGEAHEVADDEEEQVSPQARAEQQFNEKAAGILMFEEEEEEEGEDETEIQAEEKLKEVQAAASPIPQDASSKRHVSPKILKYAKPLTWENTLVGISIAGFDIGTSQGPIADESWYKEVGDGLESIAQCRKVPRPRRQISLPEMVFPTAHVAIEGHGMWMSWDALDAMEEWARAHQDIAVHSSAASRGVSVLQAKDAKLWESKRQHLSTMNSNVPSVFHYDWTFSTPFAGKVEGGDWVELDESGMRTELLTDKTSPILFFDEIILFEDDLHDNGQVEFSIKLRVMPSCAYVLARLFVRVDNVVVRVRETRLLIDFFGIKPQIFRDVTWRECYWDDLAASGLPTDVRSWSFDAGDVAKFHGLIQKLPEVSIPENVFKYATLERTPGGSSVSDLQMSMGKGLSL